MTEKALSLGVVHKGKQHLLEEDNTTAKKQQTNNSQSVTVNQTTNDLSNSEQMESWTNSMAPDSIEDVTNTQSAVGDEDNIKETSDIELCKL